MSFQPKYDHMLKLVLVGDAEAGKTALMNRMSHQTFSTEYSKTIGVEFDTTMISYQDSVTHQKKVVNLQIWDTAGDENFRISNHSNYRGATIVFIVVAANQLTHRKIDTINNYLNELEFHTDIKIGVIETKMDLLERVTASDCHLLTDEELKQLKLKINFHVSVSNKASENLPLLKQHLQNAVQAVIRENPTYNSKEIKSSRNLSDSDAASSTAAKSQYSFSWLWKWFPLFTYSSLPPAELRIKYQKILNNIKMLTNDEVISLLPLIKTHLMNGNLDRYSERYIAANSKDYTDGNVTIKVTEIVFSLLNKIDGFKPQSELPQEFLRSICLDMLKAAYSISVTRVSSSQEYYEIYFPEYLQKITAEKLRVPEQGLPAPNPAA